MIYFQHLSGRDEALLTIKTRRTFTTLTSGDVIEVKRGEQWERGRVEYNHERRDYVILLTLGGTMQITSDISLRRPEKEK